MSETVKFGDVVTIQDVISEEFSSLVGRIGTVLRALPAGRYLVQLGGDSEGVIVATAVEKIDDVVRPTSHSLTASERALYAAENHDWRDEASELDRRRTQAATFAHNLLGKDALPEEMLGLADWVLNEPTEVSAADVYRNQWGEALRKASDLVAKVDGHYTSDQLRAGGFLPNSAFLSPMIAEESKPETPRPPADQQITDKDGDALRLTYNHTLAGTVALIEAHSRGDVCSAYVTPEDADRIIAFLQDAKAARNT